MRRLGDTGAIDDTAPVGIAAGAGGLAIATPDLIYGGSLQLLAAQDLSTLGNKLSQLRIVRTADIVDVLQVLPKTMRPHLNWGTHYDMGVDAVFADGTQPRALNTVEEVGHAAISARVFQPAHRVQTYQASRVLRMLNQQTYILDQTRLDAIIEAHAERERGLRSILSPDGTSPRVIEQDKVRYDQLAENPVLLQQYKNWKRHEVCVSRGIGLAKSSAMLLREGTLTSLHPVWRFHKHWTYAASGPSLPNLPRELRAAFPARTGHVWVQCSIPTPYVRTELAASDFETTDEPVVAFAQARGFASPEMYEAVLKARDDKTLDDRVMEQTNELVCWVAGQARDRFEAGLVVVKGAVAFEMPRGAPLMKFIQQLHATLVETPTVAAWRKRGAMHFQIEAGPTWGDVRPLNPDPEFWPAELELL